MLKSKSQSMQAPLVLQARTYCSFPNTKQTYLQNNTARTGVQTNLFKQTKQPKQNKRKLRRSKNNTTMHETIKTKCLDRLELLLMKKGMPWASPSFDACTSWIFLGVTPWWHPQAWAFDHTSSYCIILSLHLQFFLHTKLHTIFISNISLFKRY